MTTQIQNFYKATLTRNWTATTGDFNVSIKPTTSSGWLIISPGDETRREIIKYSATGSNAFGDFVTISNISDRGVGGTTAQIHSIGEKIRMNITAEHWAELNANAVAPTVDVGTTVTLKSGESATVTNSGDTVNAVFDFEIPKGSTIYSTVLIPDNSIGMDGDWAFSTSSTSNVYYKSAGTWTLVNSNKGAQGDAGTGITSIVKTNTIGLVDTYTITYDDLTTSTFDITNGAQGIQGNDGDDGVSVVSIIKIGTVGLVDTYTITYSNTTTSTFDVTNGLNGTDGTDGMDGISFLWQGAYDNGTAYEPNDAVSYNGSSYMCITPSTGNLPTNVTYWDLMASKGTDGIGSGDVMGPATNSDNYIPQWDGINSKTLKNGIPTSTFAPALGVDDNYVTDAQLTKLNGIEAGAEVNNISDVNATDLTDGGATTLHKHSYNNLDDLPAVSGSSLWTLIPGTPVIVSNTSFTVTGDVTSYVAKGMIIKWTESGTVRCAMVSIPSTYGSPNTTITIIGDSMSSIDASSLKYCLLGSEMFLARFAVAGNIGAVATNVANLYHANEPMRVLGTDLQVGTAGITNSTTIDINIEGTTAFTTKPTLATTVAHSATPFSADTAKSLALNEQVSIDIDAIQTTNAVDLYVQLYVFPTRYLNLS